MQGQAILERCMCFISEPVEQVCTSVPSNLYCFFITQEIPLEMTH